MNTKSKPLKILMLNYEFPPLGGGAANANKYLLNEFAKNKNISVDLITSSKGKAKTEKFSDNITIHQLDVKKKNTHYWKMSEILKWTTGAKKLSKKLIKENNYDLCHCWFGWPCGYIGYLNRNKLPYIVALRGSDVPGYNVRLKKLDKIVFTPLSKKIWKSAKLIIANSKGLRELAKKTSKVEIKIIPNGVDINEFKPVKNKKDNLLKIVSTGRLIERKGYDYLIKALHKMPNIELTLIGGGNKKDGLKELAKKLNVKVKFLGEKKHSEIAKLLPTFDIFVLPSLNEGMSNSILEAMACGLPIITTNTGGSKELIKENGIIIKMKDSKSIKDAITKLQKDTKLRNSMGKKSRVIAETLSWKNVTKEYLEVYNV